MICKYCSQTIPDGSLFCMFCGERLARKRREKKSAPRYPRPRTLADGTLLGQLMVDGERVTVKASSEAEYRARIDGIRAGILERKAHPERRTLQSVLRAYIDKNDAVLSPSTLRGYEGIIRNRFKAYMDKPVGKLDFQRMVNDEAKIVAPKTVYNAWALVTAALRDANLPVPEINRPQIPESDEDFLDHDQVLIFLDAIRGDSCELAMLLMLHGLRMSELLKLEADDVREGQIHIRGAVVQDKHQKFVEKNTNKNRTSARTVPVMIGRLTELLPESGKLVTVRPNTCYRHVIAACEHAGLPLCSPHDLRRSCASLGYFLGWSELTIMDVLGWHDFNTAHRFYLKLAKQDLTASVQTMVNHYKITTATEKPSV